MSRRPFQVKLCGFQDKEGVETLHGLDVDMVGFILAPSKRKVSLSKLENLIQTVPEGTKKVGVFVDPTFEEVKDAVQMGRLDLVQLHGNESPIFCQHIKEKLGVRIIKAWHIGKEDEQLQLDNYRECIDYLLLDTYDDKFAGGTGKSFRWDIIDGYYAWCQEHDVRLLVAGGINTENVTELLEKWPLHGIDLSSGIETDGKKDPLKMIELMERVKSVVSST